MTSLRRPAPRPCQSCPYRRDVPSGVWAHHEYEKLRRYDAPTAEQSPRLFQCHQADADSPNSRLCAGWLGCHSASDLLALRIGILEGSIDADAYRSALEYVSPLPLFTSGGEAADHGQAGIAEPLEEAKLLTDKIIRTRGDLGAHPSFTAPQT